MLHPVIIVALSVWWVFPALVVVTVAAMLRAEGGRP